MRAVTALMIVCLSACGTSPALEQAWDEQDNPGGQLSERFSKTAEGIRALARSERYQEIRRMMLAIAADYDFLAKRAAVVEGMLSNEEPSSVYHTG
jgi:hypothetical protein